MFSGIIEEVGKIKRILSSGDIKIYHIAGKKVFDDLKEGDSISVNGVCLTVERVKDDIFIVSLSKQTLKETNLSDTRVGDYVNLERAIKLGERIGGHILTGHIDFKTPVISFYKERNSGVLVFHIPEKFFRYVVQRGSIGVDGISFTVAQMDGRNVKIFVIPYTLEHTNIKYRRHGDMLNIEVDLLAKYIENFINEKNKNEE